MAQIARNQERPSAIAFASPDKGFVAGTSDSACATELPIEPHPFTATPTTTATVRALLRSVSFIAVSSRLARDPRLSRRPRRPSVTDEDGNTRYIDCQPLQISLHRGHP